MTPGALQELVDEFSATATENQPELNR